MTKSRKRLLKQINPKSEFNGHKYKVKASYFKPWVDPSIPPPPPPPPPPTAEEIIDEMLPEICDTAVWEAEMEIRIETETFRKMDTAVVGLFTQIDANGDGVVTMREITMALRKDRGLGKRLGLRFADGEIQDRDGSRKEIGISSPGTTSTTKPGASAARVLRSPSTGRTPAAVARSHRRDAALRRGPRAGVRRRGPLVQG